MSNVWVCKHNGSIQCDPDSEGQSLDEMRTDLERIVGKDNVLKQTQKNVPVLTMCGLPTGIINAYELTASGYDLLMNGIIGPDGFTQCSNNDTDNEIPIGMALRDAAKQIPTKIEELPGHPLRVYTIGDALTRDYRPRRFNIGLDKNGNIAETWFG